MPHKIRCVIMRGGTSKAVFFREEDLPADADLRTRAILAAFGSPDRRQIDGLGGADPLTSKLAIIGPPPADPAVARGAQLTYTFGQVEITHPEIDWLSLCGNISAAVGAFAIAESYVPPLAPVTPVRVYNTNLKRILTIEVPVENGLPLEAGDYRVPGVPGSGARIAIDFADTAGGATGALLPTGNPVDRINVPEVGSIDMSLVDIGNAHVFVRARDVGLTGTESAAEIDANTELRRRLELIRGAGATRMGMVSAPDRARDESPATPILGIVSPPAPYAIDGGAVAITEIDIVSRLMFMQQTHKTYAGTSTVCTGVASRIEGSLVHEMVRPGRSGEILRIGHPAGVIDTETRIANGPDGYVVHRATLGRTARRIMDGHVHIPDAVFLPAH